MPRDRDGRTEIHLGDTVSILALTPAGHDGVGEVTQLGRRLVTVTDTGGRTARVFASDVSVDECRLVRLSGGFLAGPVRTYPPVGAYGCPLEQTT